MQINIYRDKKQSIITNFKQDSNSWIYYEINFTFPKRKANQFNQNIMERYTNNLFGNHL